MITLPRVLAFASALPAFAGVAATLTGFALAADRAAASNATALALAFALAAATILVSAHVVQRRIDRAARAEGGAL